MTTVYSMFKDTVREHSSHVAARFKADGQWQTQSWAELGAEVEKVSAALLAIGLEPLSRVSIISNTRLEWVTADLGILGAGCTTVPIYQSSTADDMQYIINDAEVVAAFVENAAQVQKLKEIKSQIPNVKQIISFDAVEDNEDGWVLTWSELVARGTAELDGVRESLEARMSDASPDDLLTLVYTSGTTGRPKGVMITHDNMVYEAGAIEQIGIITPADVQLLFLPLAHIFAKVLEVTWIKLAHEMAFAESIEKVVPNMAEVKPTFMASVPRIFEKVYAKVVSGATSQSGIKGKLARWAFSKEAEATTLERAGKKAGGLGWKLAQKLVISKVKVKLSDLFGGRLKFFISGGAPLPPDIAYFFKHSGVMILEGYGLTETSAATCVNLPDKLKLGTVGPVLPGTEVRIAEDEEIMIRGRGVFKGYWNRPEATAEALEEDGWFHSGDLGSFDGPFLKITGRKKDLIITAGGKNIAPQNIESKIKSSNPIIGQVVLHGDRRKFLSAVVTIDEAAVLEWAAQRGLSSEYTELTQSPEVYASIDDTFKVVNQELARYETVKKFKVLSEDFSIEGGELTPSLKVKRNVVEKRHMDIFDSFYGS